MSRTLKQRMIEVKSVAKDDFRSTVKCLAVLSRNIEETIETGESDPLAYLFNYWSSESAKFEKARSILSAVTYGMSVKLDEEAGFFVVNMRDKAGTNRHFETLQRYVGSAGIMNNNMLDAIHACRTSKSDSNKKAREYKADRTEAAAINADKKAEEAGGDKETKWAFAETTQNYLDDCLAHGVTPSQILELINAKLTPRNTAKPVADKALSVRRKVIEMKIAS